MEIRRRMIGHDGSQTPELAIGSADIAVFSGLGTMRRAGG
jgi:hypothetical protein